MKPRLILFLALLPSLLSAQMTVSHDIFCGADVCFLRGKGVRQDSYSSNGVESYSFNQTAAQPGMVFGLYTARRKKNLGLRTGFAFIQTRAYGNFRHSKSGFNTSENWVSSYYHWSELWMSVPVELEIKLDRKNEAHFLMGAIFGMPLGSSRWTYQHYGTYYDGNGLVDYFLEGTGETPGGDPMASFTFGFRVPVFHTASGKPVSFSLEATQGLTLASTTHRIRQSYFSAAFHYPLPSFSKKAREEAVNK